MITPPDEAATEAEIQTKGLTAREKIWALEGYSLRNSLAGRTSTGPNTW